MLNAVIKHFPDNLGIELYTRVANTGSQTFYTKYGCTPVKKINFLEPDDEKLIPHFMQQWLNLNNKKTVLYPPKDEEFCPENSKAFIGFSKKSLNRF
ncbi:MAG: hypothetical protein JSR33_09380 [Proteobacteria bacterium]|nr:hypothetical protein [Pseudomonadota bacterium]